MKKWMSLCVMMLLSLSLLATGFNGKFKAGESSLQLEENQGLVEGQLTMNDQNIFISGKLEGNTLFAVVVNAKKEKLADVVILLKNNKLILQKSTAVHDGFKMPKEFVADND